MSLPRQSWQWRSPLVELGSWRKCLLGYSVIIAMVGIVPVRADEVVDPADPASSYEDGTFINIEEGHQYNYRNENEFPYRNENEFPYRDENEFPYQNENEAGYRDYNDFDYRNENTFDYQPID